MQHPTQIILFFACATSVATPSQCATSFEGVGESAIGAQNSAPTRACKPPEDVNKRGSSVQPMMDCPSQAD